jgi:SEC-C motif-containing protein
MSIARTRHRESPKSIPGTRSSLRAPSAGGRSVRVLLHEWIEANSRAVAVRYPQFKVVEPPPGSGSVQAWEGAIQPFPNDRELGAILEDLEIGMEVIVKLGGALAHDPRCGRWHSVPPYLNLVGPADASFQLQVLAFPAKRHPRAFSVRPRISPGRYPCHPHLFVDGALCPYLPSDNVWSWGRNTVADFLDYISIWLAKHLVWERTGACRGGIWIGPYARHEPRDLLRNVGRNDQCPCGSGEKYKRCCQAMYISEFRK